MKPLTLATLIRKCTTVASLSKARELHALILTTAISASYAHSPYCSNNVLSMYVRCGSMLDARRVFDGMRERSVVSYNSLIAACSRDLDCGTSCFELVSYMAAEGFRPSGPTFTSLLQACCVLEDWVRGCLVHGQVMKCGFLDHVCVQTSLLGMYSKCGDLGSAEKVFANVVEKDVVSWNSMISGNLKNGKVKEGLCVFCRMVRSGAIPSEFTYAMVLSACSKLEDYRWGQCIHARVVVLDTVADMPLQNALLDMYCSCGDIGSAFRAFSRMENPNLVSWNSMISGFTENGQCDEAVELFVQLLRMSAPKPDEYTFAAVFSATGAISATEIWRPLHSQVIKSGFETSLFVGTTLLSIYLKNEDTACAQQVFNAVKEKDVVLWTEMIMGHCRLGDGETAIKLFCRMYQEGHKSDGFVISGALSACADLATLKQGEMIHSQAVKTGYNAEMSVCGSLIDMYAKSGNLHAAQLIFSQVSGPDLKCWNSMLGGYSHHGMAEEAMTLFEEILEQGLKPDQVTFLSLLSACSHSGWVGKGRFLWDYMKENGIRPGLKHYSCMVSLLSRAGLLSEAEELITESSYREGQLELWRTLLSSCVSRRDLRIGVRAAEQVLRLDPEDRATHILLSNLYAAAGRWSGVAEMRRKMRGMMLEKDPGLSWIEATNRIQVFYSAEQLNPVIGDAQDDAQKLQKNMRILETDESDSRIHAI